MDTTDLALAAAADPGVVGKSQQFNPDLGTRAFLPRFEPFHGSDTMPFPSAQTGNKLFGRQQRPPLICFFAITRCLKSAAADLFSDGFGPIQEKNKR